MISFQGALVILTMPVLMVSTMVKAYFVGGKYRKFKNSAINSMKLFVCHTALALSVTDCRYLCVLSNELLINVLLKNFFPSLTRKLANYGVPYDQNSIWLVRPQKTDLTDPIIIYLHGGGYYFDTGPAQLESVLATYFLVDENIRDKLSILHLHYSLASDGHQMPYQLLQLHETYSKLWCQGHTNIILMGDSAGGNLAITYCQYLKSLSLKQFPKKLMLISPWVKIHPQPEHFTPGHSYFDNDKLDIIEYPMFADMKRIRQIIGNSDLNSLTISPGNKLPHDENDWRGIPNFDDPNYDVLVITGEDEVFRDDILHWCEYALQVPLYSQFKYGDSNNIFNEKKHQYLSHNEHQGDIRVFVEPWGVHDSALLIENSLLKKIKKKPNLTLKDIDCDQYFGISRMAQFLNETLSN